jgi:hypothetical protein
MPETVDGERPVRRAISARLVVPKVVSSRRTRARLASRAVPSLLTGAILSDPNEVCQVSTEPVTEVTLECGRLIQKSTN